MSSAHLIGAQKVRGLPFWEAALVATLLVKKRLERWADGDACSGHLIGPDLVFTVFRVQGELSSC
jgi:hypothetical protein